jgi:hypothetical protein
MISFKYFNYAICLILLISLKNQIECSNNIQVPKKLSNCKAQLDSGKIIDLSPLDNSKNPKLYKFNLIISYGI